MGTATREWTVSSALSDPLIRTLMIADNVDSGRTRIDAAADCGKGCAKSVADDQGRLSPEDLKSSHCLASNARRPHRRRALRASDAVRWVRLKTLGRESVCVLARIFRHVCTNLIRT